MRNEKMNWEARIKVSPNVLRKGMGIVAWVMFAFVFSFCGLISFAVICISGGTSCF